MYDDPEFMGPAPIDSSDLVAMGFMAPRCNGCKFAQLKWELGDRFLHLVDDNDWHNVYELDAEPGPGQGEPLEHEGRPIRYRAGFMSIGHSDECYNWQPPKHGRRPPPIPWSLQPQPRQGIMARICNLFKGGETDGG